MTLKHLPLFLIIFIFMTLLNTAAHAGAPAWMEKSISKLESELASKYGASQKERVSRGLKQVSQFWTEEDGSQETFENFARENFAGDTTTLNAMFSRFERLFEQLDGHMLEIGRQFRWQTDLDLGTIYPFDEVFAGYDPSAHLNDDLFNNKIAFIVLLNFPLTTLQERIDNGNNWSRRQWAEVRLAQRFSKRIPASVNLESAKAGSEAESYIASYNIWMHHLLDENGKRIFPKGLRLLSHWNLRDEIKSDYGEGKEGFEKQKMIQKVMERIVTQTIPENVIDNPFLDWNPYTNEVKTAAVNDGGDESKKSLKAVNDAEPDTRYETLLKTFKAARLTDPYSPTAPTLIARRFDEGRELPEERVKAMLEKVVSSPSAVKIGKLIEKRLGRSLEPFDIWYNGFLPKGKYSGSELDKIVSEKYPTADAYKKDIPNMLVKLGFSAERAHMLAENILVDPARGSGHASGSAMRSEKAHLRTRVEKGGMNYKGYNIAVHEMGHNVEQTFSLNLMDHWFLQGVPNTAFTEAVAFVFQARDLELLGLSDAAQKDEALQTLNDYWAVYEIAGVALVDMQVWHWMYNNPDATPSQLKEAVLSISKDIWNKYYAPVFGKKDVVLLGIYSHMIDSFMYLPDYPMGHMIAFQIEDEIKKNGNVGAEVERMTRQGLILPDMWMKGATGSVVSPDALLNATEKALDGIKSL
ncbi:MAG TPA: hypothetical protein VHO03_08190 [Ignavibacteriales bacterium]|nr:hypothetical protein [Ignavibacteriales bacterium]